MRFTIPAATGGIALQEHLQTFVYPLNLHLTAWNFSLCISTQLFTLLMNYYS